MRPAVTLALVLWSTFAVQAADPAVSNERVAQRPGETRMDITFELAGDDGAKLRITVELSEDGRKIHQPMSDGLTGDFGRGITPGVNKRLAWEPDVEWLGRSPASLLFRITAHGGGPIPGMVWVTHGRFVMWSPAAERDRRDDEAPQTQVKLTKGCPTYRNDNLGLRLALVAVP